MDSIKFDEKSVGSKKNDSDNLLSHPQWHVKYVAETCVKSFRKFHPFVNIFPHAVIKKKEYYKFYLFIFQKEIKGNAFNDRIIRRSQNKKKKKKGNI